MSPLVLIDAPKPGAVGPGQSILSDRPPTASVAPLADADRLTDPRFAHTRAGGTGLVLRIAQILARSIGGHLLYAGGSFVLSLPLGSTDN